MEILYIILCLFAVFFIGNYINTAVELWQALPIKEEKSTPIYLTKVIE